MIAFVITGATGFLSPARAVLAPRCGLLGTQVSPRMSASTSRFIGELRVPPPPEAVVSAVEKLPGQRVLAADVAAQGGIDLDTSQRGLTELASALAGAEGLSVAASSSGDLVYSFPADVRRELS